MQHQPNPTNELNSSISQSLSSHIASNCLVTRARQVSRVLTAIYDDALRPFGIVAPQFSLLVLIAEWAPISRSELGRRSRHDRSTLTRNLRPLIVQGWVAEGTPAGDGRSRPLSLTAEGDALLRRAASAWSSAQSHATHALGNEGVDDLMNIARELALRAA